MATITEAVDEFDDGNRTVLCGIFIDSEGVIRTWLSDDVKTPDEYQWAHECILKGASQLLQMQGGSGAA
jgi:hypothetical protein